MLFRQLRRITPKVEHLRLINMITNSSSNDTSLPTNASTCEQWNNSTFTDTYQLYIMESFFNCSGWCPKDPDYNLIFLFSNINNGPPGDFCFNTLNGFFKKFGLMLKLTSFLVSGVLFIVFLTLICLCYHPQRDRSGDKSFRANFVEEEEG